MFLLLDILSVATNIFILCLFINWYQINYYITVSMSKQNKCDWKIKSYIKTSIETIIGVNRWSSAIRTETKSSVQIS